MKQFPSASKKILLGALVAFCIGVWSIILAPYFYSANGVGQGATVAGVAEKVEQSPSLSKVAPIVAAYEGVELAARSQTTGCAVVGALPDPACSPGEVFAAATPAQVCVPGYTKHVRSVSTALRKQVYAAYGIAYPPPTGTFELDHLIPLAIGGDNAAANLFPEAAEPKPGFKEKDVVEVYLQEEVCAGAIDIAAAQAAVAADWVVIFNAIDKAEVSRIRQKYTSWAN